jgi:hypothetical protein
MLDHYRALLPSAGWTITADQPLDPDDHPPGPGHLLLADGHGYIGVQIVLTTEPAGPAAQVTVTTVDGGRRPSQQQPSISVPGWYRHLPCPPPGTRRLIIAITSRLGHPTSYQITYSDAHLPERQQARTATVAGHYRTTLSRAGWTIEGERQHTDRPTTVVERRHHTIAFTGYQVTGLVHTSQATSLAGSWLGNTLRIRITDPAPQP